MSVHSIANPITTKPSIECKMNASEKKLLSRQAGRIASFIRTLLFFPLKVIKPYEGSSWQRFWETSYPDLVYPNKGEIQKNFRRYNQSIIMKMDGEEVRLNYVVVESNDCPKEGALNHLIIQGNTSTKDNNMPPIYTFLDSYLKEKKASPTLPAARFIILNHYDHKKVKASSSKEEKFLPADMEQWGFVFKKAIECFKNEYGKFNLIAAHSLGNIPVIAHLKHLKDEEFTKLFPDTIFLAKGPSSLYEVSKNVPFEWEGYPKRGLKWIIGAILYLLAKCTGWTLELDEAFVKRLKALPKKDLENVTVIATAVKGDHYFPGPVAFPASEKLDQVNDLINLYRLTFDVPSTITPKQGQHNYNPGLLQKPDLIKQKLHYEGEEIVNHKTAKEVSENKKDHHILLKNGESLVDAVLRCAWKTQLKSLAGKVSEIAI